MDHDTNKGKIVAIGGGASNDAILRHMIELSGKSRPSLLFLPTAHRDSAEACKESDAFGALGCVCSTLLLTNAALTEGDIASAITGADIIFAGGGDLGFLMDVWKRTRADVWLKRAYQSGAVLAGASSGAMCWFREGYDNCGKMRFVFRKKPFSMGLEKSFVFVEGLGLIPYCNCPHFDSSDWQSFRTAVRSRKTSGVAIEDGAALVFANDRYYQINSRAEAKIVLFDAKKEFLETTFEEDKGFHNIEF